MTRRHPTDNLAIEALHTIEAAVGELRQAYAALLGELDQEDGLRSTSYDGQPSAGGISRPTEEAALAGRRAKLSSTRNQLRRDINHMEADILGHLRRVRRVLGS